MSMENLSHLSPLYNQYNIILINHPSQSMKIISQHNHPIRSSPSIHPSIHPIHHHLILIPSLDLNQAAGLWSMGDVCLPFSLSLIPFSSLLFTSLLTSSHTSLPIPLLWLFSDNAYTYYLYTWEKVSVSSLPLPLSILFWFLTFSSHLTCSYSLPSPFLFTDWLPCWLLASCLPHLFHCHVDGRCPSSVIAMPVGVGRWPVVFPALLISPSPMSSCFLSCLLFALLFIFIYLAFGWVGVGTFLGPSLPALLPFFLLEFSFATTSALHSLLHHALPFCLACLPALSTISWVPCIFSFLIPHSLLGLCVNAIILLFSEVIDHWCYSCYLPLSLFSSLSFSHLTSLPTFLPFFSFSHSFSPLFNSLIISYL